MEGRRRGCWVMHFRVSGSHSPWVSDDITAQQWREGEKTDVELKYTSATNDGETFTSVLLCEALWGLPQHTGADEYIHGDSAVRLNRETRASGCIPALCYQICHPSALCSLSCLCSSGVLCLCVAWLRVAMVSESMWEVCICTGALGNVRSVEGGEKRTSCWF